jgi:hypothetical protein
VLLGQMKDLEIWLFGAVLVLAAGVWAVRRLRAAQALAPHPEIE